MSVNWAWATDLIPGDQAGKYLGLSNLATAGAGASSRLVGPLIDGINALRPGTNLGYPAAFAVASIAVLVGTLLMLRVNPFRHTPQEAMLSEGSSSPLSDQS